MSGCNQSQITNIDVLIFELTVNNNQIILQQRQNSAIFDSSSCPDNYVQVIQNTDKGVESQTQSTSLEDSIDNSIKTRMDFAEKTVKHSTEMVNFESANDRRVIAKKTFDVLKRFANIFSFAIKVDYGNGFE